MLPNSSAIARYLGFTPLHQVIEHVLRYHSLFRAEFSGLGRAHLLATQIYRPITLIIDMRLSHSTGPRRYLVAISPARPSQLVDLCTMANSFLSETPWRINLASNLGNVESQCGECGGWGLPCDSPPGGNVPRRQMGSTTAIPTPIILGAPSFARPPDSGLRCYW